jgi:hypothetical protein
MDPLLVFPIPPDIVRFPPPSIVMSSIFTPAASFPTTVPFPAPSRIPGEPAGPPGHVVMVTGDEMLRWSSIVPETSMVAPEAALVRA